MTGGNWIDKLLSLAGLQRIGTPSPPEPPNSYFFGHHLDKNGANLLMVSSLVSWLLARSPGDFITVSRQALELGKLSPERAKPYLRAAYNAARDMMEDSGRDISRMDMPATVDALMVDYDIWSLTRQWRPSDPPKAPDPTEEDLRTLMAKALSTPTPEAILHFTQSARRLGKFAPFNIYMIYAQRPGAGRVASAAEWQKEERTIRTGAVPILILYPQGPITRVYEELDVEPQPAREPDNDMFAAVGPFDPVHLQTLVKRLADPGGKRKLRVVVRETDFGRYLAGWISIAEHVRNAERPRLRRNREGHAQDAVHEWQIDVNGRHEPAERFVTLLHELGHLFCGHVGAFRPTAVVSDEYGWPDRSHLPLVTKEIEAELVAWWLAEREGLVTGSPHYLKPLLDSSKAEVAKVDLDRVTRAVARIRSYLGDKT